MSHEITQHDVAVFRGERAWHGLGTIIQDDLSAVEAGDKYGLFWKVAGWTLTATNPADPSQSLTLEDHVANIRPINTPEGDVFSCLGVVGAGYRRCQNEELAEFTDALASTGKVVIESVGSIRGGKKVWFLARGESIKLGGVDEIVPYLCVSNAHDGTGSIRVTPTSVRVQCANTLEFILPVTEGGRNRYDNAAISIRHSGSLASKLEAAKNAIRHYESVKARNTDLYQRLLDTEMTRDKALELFASGYAANYAVATDKDLKAEDPRARKVAERRQERMKEAANDFLARYDAEADALGIGGTAWLAVNALTGYYQHDKAVQVGEGDLGKIENRMYSNLFGVNRNRAVEALELCEEQITAA